MCRSGSITHLHAPLYTEIFLSCGSLKHELAFFLNRYSLLCILFLSSIPPHTLMCLLTSLQAEHLASHSGPSLDLPPSFLASHATLLSAHNLDKVLSLKRLTFFYSQCGRKASAASFINVATCLISSSSCSTSQRCLPMKGLRLSLKAS